MKYRKMLSLVGRLTRKWGIPRGGWRLINFVFAPEQYSEDDEIIFAFDDGLWIKTSLNSYLDRVMFFCGFYDETMEVALQNLLKPGGVVFDCGANIGFYSLRMAKSVGDEGRVVAIEPHDKARLRLRSNVYLNGLGSRIIVLPCAVSDACGKTTFMYPPATATNQGNASLCCNEPGWLSKEVELKTIDNLMAELELSRLDMIRGSVQGNELKLLRGAKDAVLAYHPIICLRYTKTVYDEAGLQLTDLLSYLDELRYKAFLAMNNSFCPFSKDMHNIVNGEFLFLHDNFLA